MFTDHAPFPGNPFGNRMGIEQEEYGEPYEKVDLLEDREKFEIYMDTTFAVYANKYPEYAHDLGLC